MPFFHINYGAAAVGPDYDGHVYLPRWWRGLWRGLCGGLRKKYCDVNGTEMNCKRVLCQLQTWYMYTFPEIGTNSGESNCDPTVISV